MPGADAGLVVSQKGAICFWSFENILLSLTDLNVHNKILDKSTSDRSNYSKKRKTRYGQRQWLYALLNKALFEIK